MAAAMEAEYESAPALSTIEESLDAYEQAARDAAAFRQRQEDVGPLLQRGLAGVRLPDPDNPEDVEDAEEAAAVLTKRERRAR